MTLPALARDRLLGHGGLPLLCHRLRDRADPRRGALLERRDPDLPAHRDTVRPPGRGALSVLQLVVVRALLLPAARARLRRTRRAARRRPRPTRTDLPALAMTAVLLSSWPARSATLVWGRCGWTASGAWPTTAPCRRTGPTGRCSSRSPTRWRTRCGPPSTRPGWRWLLGLFVAVVVTRRSHTRPSDGCAAASTALFMLPLGVSAVTLGLRLPDHPGPAAARPARLAPAGPGRPGAGGAAARGAHPGARAGRPGRPAAPGGGHAGGPPLRALLVVDLPAVWKPLLAAAGFAFACSLGEFGATRSWPATTTPPCRW